MNKAVFDAKLRISGAVCGRAAHWMSKGQWEKEMKLEIGEWAIVKLEMWQGTLFSVLVIFKNGRDVKLPMFVLDWLGVVRNKWWAGPYGRWRKDKQT
jgi:hypothetical protein